MTRRQLFASFTALMDAAGAPQRATPKPHSLREIERQAIVDALDRFNGNHTKAARYLDVSRRVLAYKMKCYGIKDWRAENSAVTAAAPHETDTEIARLRALLKECEETILEQRKPSYRIAVEYSEDAEKGKRSLQTYERQTALLRKLWTVV